jgi:hypothetical protein
LTGVILYIPVENFKFGILIALGAAVVPKAISAVIPSATVINASTCVHV